MRSYNDAIKKAGQFGLFQKRILIVIYASTWLGPMFIISGVFVVYTPPHRCFIPEIDENNSTAIQSETLPPPNLSNQSEHLSKFIPIEVGHDGKPRWSQCHRFTKPFSKISELLMTKNRTVVSCNNGWKYFANSGALSATMEFNLVCDDAWLAPLVVTTQMFGCMAGSLIGGYLSDRFGRYKVLVSNWILLLISYFLISVIPVWKVTYVFWFVMGAAQIIRLTGVMVLVNEWTPNKYRQNAGIINTVVYSIGSMVISPINYLLPNWRYFLGAYACFHLLLIVPNFWFLKEPLKWLIRNKQFSQVEAMIKQIAKVNKRTLENDETKPDKIDVDAEQEDVTVVDGPKQNLSYIDLIKIPFLRWRILIFGLAWFAAVSTYHGLSINTNNIGGNRYLTSFLNGLVDLPGSFICYIAIRKIGARRSFMMTTGISGLCLLAIPLLINVGDWAVITCSMIGKMFSNSTFATIYICTGDLFPTLLRSQAYGASSFISRWAGILIPYILFLGTMYLAAIPYLIMGSIAVAAAIMMGFLPVTKNTPLPETMEEAKLQDNFTRGFPCFKPRSKNETYGVHC